MLTAPAESRPSERKKTTCVVLTGNPNCGKTTLFNSLTGLRAKVANYAGVTVERKEGRFVGVEKGEHVTVLDLPGSYSLSPKSLDEEVARDVLLQRLEEAPNPSVVVLVLDASNLERNLYYATQVLELGYPTVLALNVMDLARESGLKIDLGKLEGELGAPVVPMVARAGEGLNELRRKILEVARREGGEVQARQFVEESPELSREVEIIAALLGETQGKRTLAYEAEARLLLVDEKMDMGGAVAKPYSEGVREAVRSGRERLNQAEADWRGRLIESRYKKLGEIQTAVVAREDWRGESFSDRVDRVLTHRVWGMAIFVGIMALIFQSIFSFAELPMTLLEQGVEKIGRFVELAIPPGDLRSLIVDGVIAGVGAVVVFLPQICLLFLFIALLEDSGYMARAAFLMDRVMSKVGLHGKSFIPMLSSFACAIPGIMATRTIESPKDRLTTIMVAPLMSCSARLPVYTLLIAACIPKERVFGFFGLQGLTMLSMYLLGIIVALLMAWLFKKTLLKGEAPLLIMELPPYKKPVPMAVLAHMWERSKLFLRRAGTVILGISILLWFLATYPRSEAVEQQFEQARQELILNEPSSGEAENVSETTEKQLAELDKAEAGEKLRRSFAGRMGQFIEPVIEPLGFDWKIGIGIVASFAAREVFVSTMSTVYNVGEADDSDEGVETLAGVLQRQERPDGGAVYTPLVGIALMVFYVFALQCVSTVAVVRRETNSWRWPIFQWVYMGVLAWVLAFITYQGGRMLGF